LFCGDKESDGFHPATLAEIWAFNLIARIQGALGTAEVGDALVEVASNACKAEQELAALHREYDDEDPQPGLTSLLGKRL
jgi:hypothetical protein